MEFNETVGAKQGIRVEVTMVSNNKNIHKDILASANGDPGASELPDIFVAYPSTVLALPDENILVDYRDYFSGDELAAFVPAFLADGEVNGRLVTLPVAKSTELLFVNKTDGDSEVFIAASNGQALKFSEKRVRVMGRTSSGVRAIRLAEGEKVVGCLSIKPDENGSYSKSLLTLTENGFGKRCDFSLFAEKGRGGKGMRCHKLTEKTGALAGIAAVEETDDVMLMTDGGMLIRTVVAQISMSGRSASGVIVMRLADGSKIIGFERIKREEEAEKEALPENDGEELDVVGDDVPEDEEAEDVEEEDEEDIDDSEDDEADDETEE